MKLNKSNYINLLKGASIFSTGGGFTFQEQINRTIDILEKGRIEILDLKDLSDNDYICTFYEIAKAGDPIELNLTKILQNIKSLMIEKKINLKGIFLGETGIESFCFDIAQQMELPIIDADCTGGRAVPSPQVDNVFLYKKNPYLPIIAVSYKNTMKVLTENNKIEELDKFYVQEQVPLVVCDHIMKVSDAKKILTKKVLKRDLNFRKKLYKTKIFSGKVTEINKIQDTRYNKGKVIIKEEKDICEVFYANEYLKANLIKGTNSLNYECPDLLSIVSKNIGIHSSELKVGQQVDVHLFRAEGKWNTKKGKKIFNLNKFC